MAGGFVLTGRVLGAEKVAATVAAFQTVLGDLTPFWTDVFAPAFFADVQDRFALQGQGRGAGGRFASGGRWAKLSPAYAVWKAAHYPDKGILERTGRLRASLTYDGGVGPEGLFIATPTSVIAGTTVPYGPAHMTGRSDMPARPFVFAPVAATWAPLLRAWVTREARARA